MEASKVKPQRVGVRAAPESQPLPDVITDGKVIPARLNLTELGPPPERPREMAISAALAEQRGED